MSKADRTEMRAEAEDAMEVLKERARRTGIPVSMTIEDIEKEIAQETGGQIVRDIERLYGDATDTLTAKPQKIYIGGEEVEVVISPRSRTKFFAVTPRDVSVTEIVKELRDQRVSNVVALGLNYTQNELKEAADLIKSALRLKK
jgi:myo-inositol catabolism protein IolC